MHINFFNKLLNEQFWKFLHVILYLHVAVDIKNVSSVLFKLYSIEQRQGVRFQESGQGSPCCWQGADASEENRGLHLHVEAQGKVPVISFSMSWATRVLEIQNGFQCLEE